MTRNSSLFAALILTFLSCADKKATQPGQIQGDRSETSSDAELVAGTDKGDKPLLSASLPAAMEGSSPTQRELSEQELSSKLADLNLQLNKAKDVKYLSGLQVSSKQTVAFAKGDAISFAIPAAALPTGALPAAAIPAQALPAAAIPANALPSAAVPASAIPASALPALAFQGISEGTAKFLHPPFKYQTEEATADAGTYLIGIAVVQTPAGLAAKESCAINSKDAQEKTLFTCPIAGTFENPEISFFALSFPTAALANLALGSEPVLLLKQSIDLENSPEVPALALSEKLAIPAGVTSYYPLILSAAKDDLILATLEPSSIAAGISGGKLLLSPTSQQAGSVHKVKLALTSNANPPQTITIALEVSVAARKVLADTEQTACYNQTASIACPEEGQPFAGQDGSLAGVLTTLEPVQSDLLNDSISGLRWQTEQISQKTHEQAMAYCAGLQVQGDQPWRLPSINEVLTLVNYGARLGEPETIQQYLWTSSPASSDGHYYAVAEQGGYMQVLEAQTAVSALCVQGNAYLPTTESSLVFTADKQFALHQDTGMIAYVHEKSQAMKTWQEALAFCEDLDAGGRKDWHLPNAKEAAMLIASGNFVAQKHWTSSTLAFAPSKAWAGDNGKLFSESKTSKADVWCVEQP